MSKQDRQGVRTPADLERKYNLGKMERTFADTLGIALNNRDSVSRVNSELRDEIAQQVTSLTRDTERIIMAALESYVKTEDQEDFRQTIRGELEVMAEKVAINFESTVEHITNVDGDLQTIVEEIHRHFDFSLNGLQIKAGDNDVKLVLDNGIIYFEINGVRKTTLDPDSLKTGNMYIGLNERMQIGNFAFIPRSNGSLDFLKVGG